MPNHVTTILTIHAPEARLNEVLMQLKGRGHDFDFNRIIPMPEELNIVSGGVGAAAFEYILARALGESDMFSNLKTSLKLINSFDASHPIGSVERQEAINKGMQYISNVAKYGHCTWYGWCRDKWGTKWNAYDTEIMGNRVKFDTAWNFPEPVIRKLGEMFPDVTFSFVYADEDAGYNTGSGHVTGQDFVCDLPDGGSDEAMNLYFQTHEWAQEEWVKVNGKWTMRDNEE